MSILWLTETADHGQVNALNTTAISIAIEFTRAMTFPAIVLKFDDMLNDGVSNMRDFAQLISQDPSLTATLLRFANSPLYGFSGKVSTIDGAVSLIGMQEIRDLVFAVSIRKTFDKLPNNTTIMVDFWRHSLCCALASKQIAEVVGHSQKAVLFTGGLMHAIGSLAMFSQIPDDCAEVFRRVSCSSDGTRIFQLEREIIGFDHHEVGAEIAKAWRFPGILRDIINFSHVPDEAPEHQFESSIVHVGDVLATMVELAMGAPLTVPSVSSSALAYIQLDEEQLSPMIPQVQALFHEMRPVFGISA